MNTRLIKLVSAAAGLAAIAALATAGVAAAQTPGPGQTPAAPNGRGNLTHRGPMQAGQGYGIGGWGGQQTSLVAVAADKLGIPATELVAELKQGKTLTAILEAKSIAPATVVDAFLAPRQAQLDARVAAGTLTRAQADAMLAQMRAQVTAQLSQTWSPKGAGLGTPGSAFADADADGVCDTLEAGGAGRGTMRNTNGPMQRGRMVRP